MRRLAVTLGRLGVAPPGRCDFSVSRSLLTLIVMFHIVRKSGGEPVPVARRRQVRAS
jgi:hypothetical protein